MYHYVRDRHPAMPNIVSLSIENFEKQLNYFETEYGFISKEDFLLNFKRKRPKKGGVLLTFDDGFSDHYDNVYPALRRRGIWGIFYIPTAPYKTGRLLQVHRIHAMLGRHGAHEVYEELKKHIVGFDVKKHCFPDEKLTYQYALEFRNRTYTRQIADDVTKLVKRTLNYYIDPKHRAAVIDSLAAKMLPDERYIALGFYMTPAEIKEMQRHGMMIGSHGETHTLMSTLGLEEEEKEIKESFKTLEEITGRLPVKTFCYPYGGAHSIGRYTKFLLKENGCKFAFSVDPRDATAEDFEHRPFELPRYDCNQFIE